MILAKEIISYAGIILLTPGVVLTQDYLNKLLDLQITAVFIEDPLYEGIAVTEYISPELQQQALSVLNKTMKDLHNKGTFTVRAIVRLATDLVEEVIAGPQVAMSLAGIFSHDTSTFTHSLNCAIYSILLGRFSDLSTSKLKELASGALLHDVGKNEISSQLLNKPGKLNTTEFELLKNHAQWGFEKLRAQRWELSSLIAHMAWQHHERIDGLGYPRGLCGESILYQARIVAIADVYEALTADRPYRPALNPHQAYEIMQAELGNHLDAQLCKCFLSKVAFYSPGTAILISTGQTALVVSIPPDHPNRPVIRIVTDPNGHPCTPYEVKLEEKPLIQIVSYK
jgi:HD-GYP domain-containing protein (c-di-GMP phosphodiesterase class II)